MSLIRESWSRWWKNPGAGNLLRVFFVLMPALWAFSGCSAEQGDAGAVKATVMRYNQLIAEGYRQQNMNPLQEVTTKDQALKLYFHMSALGEGKLRMDSSLKNIQFTRILFPKPGEATVETRETWDFTQYDMKTGTKYYEEKDFIYDMGYTLKREGARWLITNVNTIAGTSANTTVPRPKIDRMGKRPPIDGK